MLNKQQIREKYLQKRNVMIENEVNNKSKKIMEHLYISTAYKECNSVFTYVSKKNEVDTICLIEKTLSENKKVAVPKVICNGHMVYYYINSIKQLARGSFGVLEPIESSIKAVPVLGTIFIIPAVVVDKNKNRIGYGGGYFDRYLTKLDKKFLKIGLVYDFQIIDSIPSEIHDKSLDVIITENYIF